MILDRDLGISKTIKSRKRLRLPKYIHRRKSRRSSRKKNCRPKCSIWVLMPKKRRCLVSLIGRRTYSISSGLIKTTQPKTLLSTT